MSAAAARIYRPPPRVLVAIRNSVESSIIGRASRHIENIESNPENCHYLTLMREDAPQREHDLRHVLNALRWLVKTGSQWRMMPHDFPPWPAVYQQTRRITHAQGAFALAMYGYTYTRRDW